MFAPAYNVGTLCFYGLTKFFAGKSQKIVRGSSRYEFAEGELTVKSRNKPEATAPKPTLQERCERYRDYTLNKKVVKRKIFAFYHLPNCAKYFRLWTLTFPCQTQDFIAYKVLNNFLTRLRTEMKLKDYIWIAERQKNGTLHFHFVLATYLDIKEANYYAKRAIIGCIKRGEIEYSLKAMERYNGLDVSKKCGSFTQVAKYLTKYVTKNSTTSSRLPYYCSQSISRLFTCIWVSDQDLDKWQEEQQVITNEKPIFETDYFAFFGVKKIDIPKTFEQLFSINEYIYSLQNPN